MWNRKQWPYWLRGLFIGLALGFLSVLTYNYCTHAANASALNTVNESGMFCFVYLGPGLLSLLLPHATTYSENMLLFVNVLVWILLGALIGLAISVKQAARKTGGHGS